MERRELESLRVADLKKLLKDAELKVSGRKTELIERILTHRFGDTDGEAVPDFILPFPEQPNFMLKAFVRRGVAAQVAHGIAIDICAIITVAAQAALDHAGVPDTTARVLPAYLVDLEAERKEKEEHNNLGKTLTELSELSLVFVPIRVAYVLLDGMHGGHAFLCMIQPKAKTFTVFDSQIDVAEHLHTGVLSAFERAGYKKLLPVCHRRVQYDRVFCAVFTVLAAVVLATNPMIFDLEPSTRDHIIEDILRQPRIFLSALRWIAELKAPDDCMSYGLRWMKNTPFLMLAGETAHLASMSEGIETRMNALMKMVDLLRNEKQKETKK